MTITCYKKLQIVISSIVSYNIYKLKKYISYHKKILLIFKSDRKRKDIVLMETSCAHIFLVRIMLLYAVFHNLN